jgi:urate oxidase
VLEESKVAMLAHNEYGKSTVRFTKLNRDAPGGHELAELSVDVVLQGDFDAAYTDGDNSRVIATDSCKNAVHLLAHDHAIDPIEGFAGVVVDHFVNRYQQVERAAVSLRIRRWQRMTVEGDPHPSAFTGPGAEEATCRAVHDRGTGLELRPGIDGLAALKSANSSFAGFWTDEYRTLADTDDRILATKIRADWIYSNREAPDRDWDRRRAAIRTALLETFALHDSVSVQATLYAMGRAALEACDELQSIDLVLPNLHHVPADLTPFGVKAQNTLFIPVPEPFGRIAGTISRT